MRHRASLPPAVPQHRQQLGIEFDRWYSFHDMTEQVAQHRVNPKHQGGIRFVKKRCALTGYRPPAPNDRSRELVGGRQPCQPEISQGRFDDEMQPIHLENWRRAKRQPVMRRDQI